MAAMAKGAGSLFSFPLFLVRRGRWALLPADTTDNGEAEVVGDAKIDSS